MVAYTCRVDSLEHTQRKRARWIVLFGFLLVIAGASTLPQLRFDYNFEQFFPNPDPDLDFYREFNTNFPSGHDFLMIGIVHEPSIYEQAFLNDIDQLSQDLLALEAITSVYSPTWANSHIATPLGALSVPYLHPNRPETYASDSIRISQAPEVLHALFSADGEALAIHLSIQNGLDEAAEMVLLEAINQELSAYDFQEVHLAGNLAGKQSVKNVMRSEMRWFSLVAALLLLGILLLTFRSWQGVLLPLFVVLVAVLLLLAVIALSNRPINLLTSVLPVILLVVGISDAIHLLEKFLEERSKGLSKADSLRKTIREVGRATLLTSLTTAIGFLTLLTSRIAPVREFALFAAIGVLLAYGTAIVLIPALLRLNNRPLLYQKRWGAAFWRKLLHPLLALVFKRKRVILLGSLCLVLLSVWGASRITIDNYFLEDWPDEHPHRLSYEFFEDRFAGHRPFELAIWVKDSTHNLTSFACLQEVEKIEQHLTEAYHMRGLSSPVSFFKVVHRGLNGGRADAYKLPETEAEYGKMMRSFKRLPRSSLKYFLTADGSTGRITGKIPDVGGQAMAQKQRELERYLAEEVNHDVLGFRLTGVGFLIDQNNRYLSSSLGKGLLLAILAVALLMGLLYRSWRMVFIALLANLLPLILVAGVMGFAGINLKISTAIIFTIAFGIAVDDTIHFMSKFRLELQRGASVPMALKSTYLTTGKAIVMTSLVLCAGFVILIFSTLQTSLYFGILVSLALLFAVLVDLLILPALLLAFYRPAR